MTPDALARPAALAGLLLAAPAFAIDYAASLEAQLAYSGSSYHHDVADDDDNAHSNGSWGGVSASVGEGGYRLFGVFQYGVERFNESVPNVVAGKREREAYAGVSSPYGTLGFGRQVSFFRRAGMELDPFHDTSVAGFNGMFAAEGASYGLSNLTNAFNDETLAYASPSWMGFSLRGAYFMDAAGDADEDYGLGLRFSSEDSPVAGGIEYLDSDGGDAVFGVGKGVPFEATRLYGSYRWNTFSFGASWERVDVSNEADARNYSVFTASWQVMEKLNVAAALGVLRDVVPNAAANPDGIDGEGLTVGAFYEVYPKLVVYAAGRVVDLDSGADSDTIAVGASYRLSHSLLP